MIDKDQFEDYGLAYTYPKLYGSSAAGNLLSVFSCFFTVFLRGFSLYMDLERTKQLQKCEVVCQKKYSIRPLALMSMRR